MSLLRDKLSAMRSADRPLRPVSGFGLSEIKTRCEFPAGLIGTPDAQTLARMGFSGEWPGTEELLFLDTETTGLAGGAGTVIFLMGAGYIENGSFTVRQFLLGDYCDEAELISRTAELMSRFKAVVTFNGDSFDLPLLWSRATMNRMSNKLTALTSYDCLKPARRLWKKRLGSVKLSVLEKEILRRGRDDDLPGSEAPKRFFEYLKTADRTLLDPVAEHNRLDVVSMAYLLAELVKSYANPSAQREAVDLMSMARAVEKFGDRQTAIACYNAVSAPRSVVSVADLRFKRSQTDAQLALGLIYKRAGDVQRALGYFETAAERGGDGRAMTEMAKHCEHKLRDFEKALYWTRRAMNAEKDETRLEKLRYREKRLISRLQNGGMSKWD